MIPVTKNHEKLSAQSYETFDYLFIDEIPVVYDITDVFPDSATLRYMIQEHLISPIIITHNIYYAGKILVQKPPKKLPYKNNGEYNGYLTVRIGRRNIGVHTIIGNSFASSGAGKMALAELSEIIYNKHFVVDHKINTLINHKDLLKVCDMSENRKTAKSHNNHVYAVVDESVLEQYANKNIMTYTDKNGKTEEIITYECDKDGYENIIYEMLYEEMEKIDKIINSMKLLQKYFKYINGRKDKMINNYCSRIFVPTHFGKFRDVIKKSDKEYLYVLPVTGKRLYKTSIKTL